MIALMVKKTIAIVIAYFCEIRSARYGRKRYPTKAPSLSMPVMKPTLKPYRGWPGAVLGNWSWNCFMVRIILITPWSGNCQLGDEVGNRRLTIAEGESSK
jgi:hypothetical protein